MRPGRFRARGARDLRSRATGGATAPHNREGWRSQEKHRAESLTEPPRAASALASPSSGVHGVPRPLRVVLEAVQERAPAVVSDGEAARIGGERERRREVRRRARRRPVLEHGARGQVREAQRLLRSPRAHGENLSVPDAVEAQPIDGGGEAAQRSQRRGRPGRAAAHEGRRVVNVDHATLGSRGDVSSAGASGARER